MARITSYSFIKNTVISAVIGAVAASLGGTQQMMIVLFAIFFTIPFIYLSSRTERGQ